MAEKKKSEAEGPPKTKLLMIGAVLIAMGLGLSVYEWLRPRTKEEKRAQQEIEEQERREAARDAREAAARKKK